jgi:predicted ester cyclase
MQQSDKTKCAEQLKELATMVTEEDRLTAALEHHCSYTTIIRYLAGEAKKLDFAIKLIQFFNKRVQERQRTIA